MRAEEVIRMAGFRGDTRLAEPMSKHTSLFIGGPAEAMVFPVDAAELSSLREAARANGVPVFLLGNGTNLLVRDGGIEGLVINLSKMDWIIKEEGADGP